MHSPSATLDSISSFLQQVNYCARALTCQQAVLNLMLDAHHRQPPPHPNLELCCCSPDEHISVPFINMLRNQLDNLTRELERSQNLGQQHLYKQLGDWQSS